MRHFSKLLSSAATILFIGSIGAVAQEKDNLRPWVQQKHFERMCAAKAPSTDDKMTDRLGKYLLLSDTQLASIKEVHETFLKSMTDAKSLCTAKMDFQTVPGRMAFDEAMMEARLNGVKQVRVKMDAFYGTLNDQQKAKFNLGYNRNQRNWRHPDDGE